MENTSKLPKVSDRDIFYYRQRSKNRLFEVLTSFFAQEAERRGVSKKDIAECLHRDPASITRWLTSPSNLTVETTSDLLLSLGAEIDYVVARFEERPNPNEMHELIARLQSHPPKVDFVQKPDKRYVPLDSAHSSGKQHFVVE